MLGRRHGVQLAFTPMLNSNIFMTNPTYRKHNWEPHALDRPLIAQVCGDDADAIIRTGRVIQDDCDAIDLNLGCPQNIAKRGHYGAFLQDEWELVRNIVQRMSAELDVPVTCKIRVFPCVQRTIRYAQMLVRAGAQMLTVHGRTRDQKGTETGLADWTKIKAVVEAVSVPVVANGNILSLADVDACIAETGAACVMSAEGHLYNPHIFASSVYPRVVDMVDEYLALLVEHPTSVSWIRGHLFKLYRACFSHAKYVPFQAKIGMAKTETELRSISLELNGMLREDEAQNAERTNGHWLCIPYVRHKKSGAAKEEIEEKEAKPADTAGENAANPVQPAVLCCADVDR